MPITIYVEIAIGIVTVWLILSMGVSAILEWISGLLKWRSRDLEVAIRDLLEEGIKGDSPHLAKALYDHPLIASLSKGKSPTWFQRKVLKMEESIPSYIPDRSFGLALFDLLMTAGTEESMLKVWSAELERIESADVKQVIIENVLNELARAAKAHISEEDGYKLADRLSAEAEKIKGKLIAEYPEFEFILGSLLSDDMIKRFTYEILIKSDYDMLTEGAARFAVNSPKLMATIDGLLLDAQGSLKKGEVKIAEFRTSVETWFNDSMTRLGGYYKRRAQLGAFLIAIGFAVFMNVDTLAVVRTLWRDPTARSAVVAEAQSLGSLPEAEESVKDAVAMIDEKLEAFTLPSGWKKLDAEACKAVKDNPEVWEYNCIVAAETYPIGMPYGAGFWVEKIVGFLLSGAAAAQGAPFWFEILTKLVNMRSSGKNPDEEKKKKKEKE